MHSTHPILLAGFQLAFTVLLADVPFISAASTPPGIQLPRSGLHLRDLVVQQRDVPVLPQGWSSIGCYTDEPAQRTLTSFGFTDPIYMTVEYCVDVCNDRKNVYAGVENGEDCYCGNVLTVGATSAPPGDCSSDCVGDSNKGCGGNNRLDLYWSGGTPPPQPAFVRHTNLFNFIYVGCFNDSNDARALTVKMTVDGGQYNNSVESCTRVCGAAGYNFAGVEFANECWCDDAIQNGSIRIDTERCMLACSGDSSEICGGANSIVVYA